MTQFSDGGTGRKWYEKYLPFVAKSPEMQLEWLVGKLSRLRTSKHKDKNGLLSCEEIQPYISLLLDSNVSSMEVGSALGGGNILGNLLENVSENDFLLMIECAEIYDIPRLFGLTSRISREMAVLAMKKVPPLYEKSPLLVSDRVFHAIKEKSADLLESAAEEIMASDDVPDDFLANYERFREIMMDEHILALLYPKAN